MHPELLSLFQFPIRSYGLAMATAFVINIWLINRRVPLEHLNPHVVFMTCLWIVVGTLLGGRMLFVLTNWSIFADDPAKLVSVKEGGLVFYGGFIGSFIAGIGYLIWANLRSAQKPRFLGMLIGLTLIFGYLFSGYHLITESGNIPSLLKYFLFWNYAVYHCVGFLFAFPITAASWLIIMRGQPRPHRLLPIIDLIMPYAGLGLAMHRSFGCFLNGCCFGRPTDVPWGVLYPVEHVSKLIYGFEAHLHPTQLYQATNAFLIFLVLILYRRTRPAPGKMTAVFFMMYAPVRYGIEFFRGDILRGQVGDGMPVISFVAVFGLVTALLAWLIHRARTHRRSESSKIWSSQKVYTLFLGVMAALLAYILVMERFRNSYTPSVLGPFTTSQFIGFVIFSAGVTLFAFSRNGFFGGHPGQKAEA